MRSERSAFFGTGFKPLRATARANISGVHSGASPSRTTSASIIFRTLERLVEDLREVVARFMFRGLANRNDTNIVTTFRMRNRHDLILQKAQRKKPRFSIGLASILRRKGDSAKDPSRRRQNRCGASLGSRAASL